MKFPAQILDLMRGAAYNNSNHPEHRIVAEQVADYFNHQYSGAVQYDATGRMIEPAPDTKATNNINAKTGITTPATKSTSSDKPAEPTVTVWVAGGGCGTCEDMDGAIIAPGTASCPHPNCICGEETMTMTEYNRRFGGYSEKRQSAYEKNKALVAEYNKKYGVDLYAQKQGRDDALTDEFKKDLMKHEGISPSPYKDSKNLITIGIGNNINDIENFEELELTNTKNGKKLTNPEKSELHDQIRSEIDSKIFNPKNYEHIQISPDRMYKKFETQIKTAYNEVSRKFNDFNLLPVPVRQALTDMQFNMGTPKFSKENWPKLFDAVQRQDWLKAAKEGAERKDVGDPRKNWTYNMFMSATVQ